MLTPPFAYRCLASSTVRLGDYSIAPIQPEHIESIRCWRNDQMDVLRQGCAITPAQQSTYYENVVWPDMERTHPSNILFALSERGQQIGYGGLVHIAWEHLRAEISFLVAPERARNDAQYRTDFLHFLSLMRCVAFSDLRLNRLFTETYAHRDKHISILEEFGLRLEGRMREHVMIDGVPTDSLIHGYLRSEHVE